MRELEVPWDEISLKIGIEPGDPGDPKEKTKDSGKVQITFTDAEHLGVTAACKDATLTIESEYVSRPQTEYFEEDLAIYARPADILKVHKERPDVLRAKKSKSSCDGDCDSCTKDSGHSCSKS